MSKAAITGEARRIVEDLLWIKTAHYQMATLWRAAHWLLGVPTVTLTAVAGVAAVKDSHPVLVATCALTATVLSALQTFVNPQKAAKDTYTAGVRATVLRERLRRFHEIDLQADELPKSARQDLEALANEKAHLLETSPHTGGLAYWLARWSIGRGQHVHVVDRGRPSETTVT